MDRVIDSLSSLYDRVSSGEFIDKFDALSLSGIELEREKDRENLLPLPPNTSSHASSPSPLSFSRVHLHGLERLCSELSDVLAYGVIHQQVLLSRLGTEFHSEMEQIEEKKKKLLLQTSHDNQNISIESTNDWDTLPMASTHILTEIFTEETSSLVVTLKREHHQRLQKIYNEVYSLHQMKGKSFEFIDAILAKYSVELSKLADGVSHSLERCQLVVKHHATPLLLHRFMDTAQTRELLASIRTHVSVSYMRGHEDFAETKLSLQSQPTETTPFQPLSFKVGIGLVLLCWAVSECINNELYGRHIWLDPTFSIFIALGDLILLLFMWTVSLYVWRTSGINYITLLSLQNTDYSFQSSLSLIQIEINLLHSTLHYSLLFLISFILFNKMMRKRVGEREGESEGEGDGGSEREEEENALDMGIAHVIPTILFAYVLYSVFNPWRKRKVYWMMLWRVLAAPFYAVNFRDGYIGDLLTSLVRVSISLLFSVLYLLLTIYWWLTNHLHDAESTQLPSLSLSPLYRYVLIPFLTLFPLWLRLLQCLRRSIDTGHRWPHYFNAMKYTSAILVFSLSLFSPSIRSSPLWILSLISATCYQFLWDITMDWGLVLWDKEGKIRIREERSICGPKGYLLIVGMNLLLRFSWAITLLPEELTQYSTVYSYIYANFQTVMAAAEIIRRMVWGFFRLEWEYIEKYGSAPVPTTQLEQLEIEKSIMDQRKKNPTELSPSSTDLSTDLPTTFSTAFSSLTPMNISSSTHQRRSIDPLSLFEYCWRMGRHETGEDWEWFEYFGLSPEQLLSEETLRRWVPNEETVSRVKWLSRVIEGAGLCSLVIGMIIYAISIGEYD